METSASCCPKPLSGSAPASCWTLGVVAILCPEAASLGLLDALLVGDDDHALAGAHAVATAPTPPPWIPAPDGEVRRICVSNSSFSCGGHRHTWVFEGRSCCSRNDAGCYLSEGVVFCNAHDAPLPFVNTPSYTPILFAPTPTSHGVNESPRMAFAWPSAAWAREFCVNASEKARDRVTLLLQFSVRG